jgi:hypothetical protein
MIEIYRWRKPIAIIGHRDWKLFVPRCEYLIHGMYADDTDEFTYQWAAKL